MREVVITPRAEKEINKIVQYLVENWGFKVKKEFIKKVKDAILLIQKNPELYPFSTKNKDIRKCVIVKQISVFYYFNDVHIVILSIFDNRQNQKKVVRKIK